jgi:hypothetical protein
MEMARVRNVNDTKLRCLGALGRMGALATLGLCVATASAAAANLQLDGIWRIEKPVFAVKTLDGKAPPLKPEAAKLYAAHQSARKAGDTSFDSATWCASVGMPRILFIDYPFQLVVREPYVAFLHQWNWWTRIVYLDGALSKEVAAGGAADTGRGARRGGPGGGTPAGSAPAGAPDAPRAPIASKEAVGPMGLSKGRWEGDTLVIDTDTLGHLTLLDGAGMPHSQALKITEHVSLRSRDVLVDRIRIEDPETFTAPWETQVTYKRQPGGVIEEDVCLDRIKNRQPAVRE